LEQLVTFEAGIGQPTAQQGQNPISPAAPGQQAEPAFSQGMAQALQNGFPASESIQGKEGDSPVRQSNPQPTPSAAGGSGNIG